jgi:hypothetical protein
MTTDPSASESPDPQEQPTERQSLLGLRIALAAMAVLAASCGFPTLALAPELEYLGSTTPPQDEMHATAMGLIFAFAPAIPLYLLALIHVGLTKRGKAYIALAVGAFWFQVAIGVIAQPFFGCLAQIPVIIAGVIAMVIWRRPGTQERLALPSSSKPLLWPDLVIVPAGIALVVVLIAQLDGRFVPYEEDRNPPREFDSSEGWERLERAVEDTVPAFEAVEGFNGFGDPDYDESDRCDAGGAWDEEWVELRITYDLGNLDPDDELSMAYVDSLLEYWPAHGYEITDNAPREAAVGGGLQSYRVEAERDDGVTVTYQAGYGSADLTVNSGCILKADDFVPTPGR